MGQFVETIDGISQACTYLDFPVVSGNVSFYNETNNSSISPTPTIGGVGLIKNLDDVISSNFKEAGSNIYIIGKTLGHLYQSEFFKEVIKFYEGPPPPINLFNEKNNGLLILDLILKKLLNSVHDISSGGMLIALSEMCILGKIGAKIKIPQNNISKHEYLFGEDQSRYIIEVNQKNAKEVEKNLKNNNVYYDLVGKTQKNTLTIDKELKITVDELSQLNKIWFTNYFR